MSTAHRHTASLPDIQDDKENSTKVQQPPAQQRHSMAPTITVKLSAGTAAVVASTTSRKPSIVPYRSIPLPADSAIPSSVHTTGTHSHSNSISTTVDLTQQIETYKQQLLNAQASEITLRNEIESLKGQIQEMQGQVEEKKELQAKLVTLESSLAASQSAYNDLQSRHSKTVAQLASAPSVSTFQALQCEHELLKAEHVHLKRQSKVVEHAAGIAAAVWTMDSRCSTCTKSFSFFKRRHHCRSCGDSVCAGCSKEKAIVLSATGKTQAVRACKACLRDINEAKQHIKQKNSISRMSISTSIAPSTSFSSGAVNRPRGVSFAPEPSVVVEPVPIAPPVTVQEVPIAPPLDIAAFTAAVVAPSNMQVCASPTASMIRKSTFDESQLLSVQLRAAPAPTPSASKAPRDCLLADIKNPRSALKTPRAVRASPSQSLRSQEKPDLLTMLKRGLTDRRIAMEQTGGSDRKSQSGNSRKSIHDRTENKFAKTDRKSTDGRKSFGVGKGSRKSIVPAHRVADQLAAAAASSSATSEDASSPTMISPSRVGLRRSKRSLRYSISHATNVNPLLEAITSPSAQGQQGENDTSIVSQSQNGSTLTSPIAMMSSISPYSTISLQQASPSQCDTSVCVEAEQSSTVQDLHFALLRTGSIQSSDDISSAPTPMPSPCSRRDVEDSEWD